MLLLSFSNLTADARILRQIELFKDEYQITTCGYGPAPEGVSAHLRIPDELVYWKYPRLPLMLRQYRFAYFHSPVISFAYPLLKQRDFDVIWANDFDTIPLAFALNPRLGVHADLHEYFLSADNRPLRFRLFFQPFRVWVLRKYLPLCRSVTSVTPTIAEHYQRLAHKSVGVVVNAAPYEDYSPTPVHEPIRLVHVGATMPERGLEEIVEAVATCDANVKLDCYLVPGDIALLNQLKDMASTSKGKVRILDPVPHTDLIKTMNDYDVSLMFIQPTHFSYEYCLPNKLFQSIQARLAIVTGPSPEIATIVQQYQIGAIAAGFSTSDVREAVEGLTAQRVHEWKEATQAAARKLSSEKQSYGWSEAQETWA